MNYKYAIREAIKVLDEINIANIIDEMARTVVAKSYNYAHPRSKIKVSSGCSRTTIIFKKRSWVIKVFRGRVSAWHNSANEERNYARAEELGIEKYFVKTYSFNYHGYYVQVMEKITPAKDVGYECSLLDSKLLDNDVMELISKIYEDDHEGNWGFDMHGEIKILDYTC